MVLDGKFLQNTQIMLAFPPEHSNDLPDDVICNDAIYADDTTF